MHQWVHKAPFSILLLFKGWSRISPYPEEGVRSKFVIASRNVCVGPGGPKYHSDEKLLGLVKVQYCPLEEAFVGYVEEGNIRPSTESCFFNEGRVCCVGVTEMPSRRPGWHFSISDKQKMLFFWFDFKHFFLKKFRGKPIFECSYSWSTSWSNFSSVWHFFPPWPT